jgi:hypothetical protein
MEKLNAQAEVRALPAPDADPLDAQAVLGALLAADHFAVVQTLSATKEGATIPEPIMGARAQVFVLGERCVERRKVTATS